MNEDFPCCGGGVVVLNQMTPVRWSCGLFGFDGDVLFEHQKNVMTLVWLWYGCGKVQMTSVWWFCGLFCFDGDVLFENQKKCNDPGVVVVRFTDNNTTLGLC